MQSIPTSPTPPLSFTASIPQNKAKSFLQALWQKICSVVSKIFANLTNFLSVKHFFTSREITLLRDERSRFTPTSPPPSPPLADKNITVQTPSSTSPICTLEAPKHNPEPVYRTYDPTLENLREFIKDFSILGIDVIYEKHIVEHLESVQTVAPSLPPIIKSVAKLVVEMGDKAAKPLFKRFAEQKAQTIDPALQKIFTILLKPDYNIFREKLSKFLTTTTTFPKDACPTDYITPLLTWFSTPENQRVPFSELYANNKNIDQKLALELYEKSQVFWNDMHQNEIATSYDSFEKQLCVEFKEAKIPLKENIETDYIQPILAWLLLSNHTTPLTDLFGKMDVQREELVDKIFERTISLLVEKKIDQYSHILESTMQRRLGEIIQQMMKKNAGRIADFFSERISELISSMPFTQTIDELIHNTLRLQILGIIDAENDLEVQKQLLEKATALAAVVPKNEEALEAQIRAQNHLNSVEKHGGKEAFLKHAYLEKFSQHPACSPALQQIIDQEINLILQGKDPSVARRASQKALYTTIAENLVTLMTPTRKKLGANGEVEETDPFIELWDMLYLPEEFTTLIKHSEELAQELVTPDTTALFEKIKQPAVEILKNLFKSTAKDLLKKHLVEVVQTAFEKITSPEKINEMSAEVIFPVLNSILVETFTKHELGRNLKEFAPLFHKLVTGPSDEHDKQVRTIQYALIKLAKSKFQQFKPSEFYSTEEDDKSKGMTISELSPIDWLNLTHSVVLELEQDILRSQVDNKTFDAATTTPVEINDILKKAFSSESKANNPAFGELAMNLLFKMGKLSNEGLIGLFIKDNISRSLTAGVEPWRQSYHMLVETTTEALKRKFLDPNAVKALFSDQPVVQPAFTEQNLAHQIDVTSRLAHDIIMGVAHEKGTIVKFATKKVITSGPEEINRIITSIYKKMLGTSLINQNLAVQVFEKVFLSLAVSAESIRMGENIRAHQLAANYKPPAKSAA